MPNAITEVVDRIGVHRLLLLALGIGSVAVIFGFSRWGMAPSYVPVSAGLSIDQMGEATQLLTEQDIPFELERGGSLLTVPDSRAAEARVALAAAGLGGSNQGRGFELFDEAQWGMTEFTQRVNYRRALEGELERTIGQMRDVERARVHLALQQRSFLRGQDGAAEASVVVESRTGLVPDEAVVEGIQSLVSGSVEGLAATAVRVLDDRGRLLSMPDGEDGSGMTAGQLKVRSQIEEYLEGRAEALVTRIVGHGNASVRVAAELNFDQLARTTQALDPDQQMIVSEDRAEITPGDPEQGAASSQRAQTFEATRSVETLSRGGARLERLTVAVLVSDHQSLNPDGTIAFQPRTAEELRQLEDLVARAVGVSQDRGDEISVVSSPIAIEPQVAEMDAPFDFTGLVMATQRPVVALAGLGVALFLGLRILATVKALPAPPSRNAIAEPVQPAAVPQRGEERLLEKPEPQNALNIADPEMAARVLRSWMQEA